MLSRRFTSAVAAVVASCAMWNSAQAQFQPGEFVTHSQDSWGGDPAVPGSGAALVSERFFFVYPGGGVSVGSGLLVLFTAPHAVVNYLPASGANAPLNATLVDPTSTAAGPLGGHVLALQLDVDFADAGYLAGSAGVPFGDLTLVNMSSVVDGTITRSYPAYEGLTVRLLCDQMNVALGSGVVEYSFDNISYLTEVLTRAFEGGQPSQFAQNHLRIVPEPSAVALALLGWFGLTIRRSGRKLCYGPKPSLRTCSLEAEAADTAAAANPTRRGRADRLVCAHTVRTQPPERTQLTPSGRWTEVFSKASSAPVGSNKVSRSSLPHVSPVALCAIDSDRRI